MQWYENAGGYGVPDYYNMMMQQQQSDGYGAMSDYPMPPAAPARRGRGGPIGAKAGGRGGRGGGPMRGRGGGGAGRFNPMAGANKMKADIAASGHIVFAYNIGPQTGEEDVRQLFQLYGTVSKVDVIWNYQKNMGKGYAFVTMPNYEEAEYAIQQLNGYNYAGKPLQVSFKSDKKN